MAIFAYYQYIEGGWVVGSEKVQKPAYVIFEWSLSDIMRFVDSFFEDKKCH